MRPDPLSKRAGRHLYERMSTTVQFNRGQNASLLPAVSRRASVSPPTSVLQDTS
jgi:hypothetical protein